MTLLNTLLALTGLALTACMLRLLHLEAQADHMRRRIASQQTRIQWLEDAAACQQERIACLVQHSQEQEQIILDQAALIERLDKFTQRQAFWYVTHSLPSVNRTHALAAQNRISVN
jgi:hypothetical protein